MHSCRDDYVYTLYATVFRKRRGEGGVWAAVLYGENDNIYRVPFAFALYLPKALIAIRQRNGKER